MYLLSLNKFQLLPIWASTFLSWLVQTVPLVFNFTLNIVDVDVFIEVYQYQKNQQLGLELMNSVFPVSIFWIYYKVAYKVVSYGK